MKRVLILAAILGVLGCKSNKPAPTTTADTAPPPVAYVPPAQAQTPPPSEVAVPAEPGPVTQGPSTVHNHKKVSSNAVASDTTTTKHHAKGAITGNKYTVKAGDTLSKISQRKYGTVKKVKAILKANPGLKADKLKVGQVIILP